MKLVLDIGGTHTRLARAGTAPEDIRVFPTSPKPARAVAQIVQEARAIAGSEPIEAVASAVAGVNQNGSIIHSPNLPDWDGFALSRELGGALEAPVTLINDADAAALGEATSGAGQGARIVALLSIGTGVGGGRVVDGHIDAATFGFEPGQMVVDPKTGATLESEISGGALMQKFNTHPQGLSAEEYAARVALVAMGLHNLIMLWSPEVVVLGGGTVNEENGYRLADIRTALEKLPNIFPSLPKLCPAALGDSAGLYGALAMLM